MNERIVLKDGVLIVNRNSYCSVKSQHNRKKKRQWRKIFTMAKPFSKNYVVFYRMTAEEVIDSITKEELQ